MDRKIAQSCLGAAGYYAGEGCLLAGIQVRDCAKPIKNHTQHCQLKEPHHATNTEHASRLMKEV